VTRAAVRIVAVLLLVICGGLPVAGLVCARTCAAATNATLTDESPCHESGADAPGIDAQTPDSCNPFEAAVIATRDRALSTFQAAVVSQPSTHVRQIVLLPVSAAHTWQATAVPHGRSISAHRLLRI
jgi:hypothetical protein